MVPGGGWTDRGHLARTRMSNQRAVRPKPPRALPSRSATPAVARRWVPGAVLAAAGYDGEQSRKSARSRGPGGPAACGRGRQRGTGRGSRVDERGAHRAAPPPRFEPFPPTHQGPATSLEYSSKARELMSHARERRVTPRHPGPGDADRSVTPADGSSSLWGGGADSLFTH